MDLHEIAGWLKRAGLNAVPCSWLSAISLFVDEDYENFDFDLIGPTTRLKLGSIFEGHGYRQRSGRVFEGPHGRIEFPRPTRSLASDPAAEFETLLESGAEAVIATPTQILLATWRREGPVLPEARLADLGALVREQPANLDKVRDWLRRTDHGPDFDRHRAHLTSIQDAGSEQRRSGSFH